MKKLIFTLAPYILLYVLATFFVSCSPDKEALEQKNELESLTEDVDFVSPVLPRRRGFRP